MALDQLYQQLILEHNRNPRNFGRLENPTHTARGQDALCGDDILIELKVVNDQIEQARFSGQSCAITRASASLLTDWLTGRTTAEVGPTFDHFHTLLTDATIPDLPDLGDINQLRAVSQFPARRRNAELPWKSTLRALNR